MQIDVDILSGRFNGPPDEEFSGFIHNKDGKQVGNWTAFFCESKEKLFEFSALGASDDYLLKRIPASSAWPIAFLDSIYIEEEERHSGYGTLGLTAFAETALTRGAAIGLACIQFFGTEEETINRNFYRKNGWIDLDDLASDEPAIAYLPISVAAKMASAPASAP